MMLAENVEHALVRILFILLNTTTKLTATKLEFTSINNLRFGEYTMRTTTHLSSVECQKFIKYGENNTGASES